LQLLRISVAAAASERATSLYIHLIKRQSCEWLWSFLLLLLLRVRFAAAGGL
jgi:hypothetical protein